MSKNIIKIFKTIESTASGAKNDGLYFTTDTHRLMVSIDSSRFYVSDIEMLKTESERSSLLAPLNKFYYVIDGSSL